MIVYGLYLQEGTPLALFDAVEVDPVAQYDWGPERISEDQIETLNPSVPVFWSVYLHYDSSRPENAGFGGCECIADLPTKEAACAYAKGVYAALQSVRDIEE